MSQLVDELEQAIRDHILSVMPTDSAGELASMQLGDLLTFYGAWRSRLVSPRPRKTHTSRELQANPQRAKHEPALAQIIKKIEAGDDLTPNLSRTVEVAHDPVAARKSKLTGRKDRDLLIADWDIHHLHLSMSVDRDGFVSRTGDLLFAAFDTDDAYLINIYPHGAWGLKELLEIFVRNWPAAGLLTELRGVVALSQDYSDEERLELRNAGIAQPIEIDGRIYMPPGQTTAGTPIAASQGAHQVMWKLQELREADDHLVRLLNEADPDTADQGDWHPAIHEERYGFENDAGFVPVGPLPS